jgi:hypothetical protein
MTTMHARYTLYALSDFDEACLGQVHRLDATLGERLRWAKTNGYSYMAVFNYDGNTAYRFATDITALITRVARVEGFITEAKP